MITITVPVTCSNPETLAEFRREQSAATRIAYKQFKNGSKEKDVRKHLASFEFTYIDATQAQNAVLQAKALCDAHPTKTIVFGGKKNFQKRCKGLISKQEWKDARLRSFDVQGQMSRKGNRYFRLQDGKLLFQMNRKTICSFQIGWLRKNYAEILKQLESLAARNALTLQVRVTGDRAHFTFDEKLVPYYAEKYRKYQPIPGRVAGIDLNPDEVGVGLLDGESPVEARNFVFGQMDSGKKRHETLMVAERIVAYCRHHRVEKIVFEDLDIESKDHCKGRNFNRMVNNEWHRTLLFNKVKRLAGLHGICVVLVNAAYSSFCGQLTHPHLPSSCAAAVEVGRRGGTKFEKGKFYPRLPCVENLASRWKDAPDMTYGSWVELYRQYKTLRVRWRVSWRRAADAALESLAFMSRKSRVMVQTFSPGPTVNRFSPQHQ